MTLRQAIDKLVSGLTAVCRPRGNSMVPYIKDGEEVQLTPTLDNLKVGDIVACKVKGRYLLHKISAIQGDRYQISNASGFVNGWIKKENIFGRLV